jgi:hypothetical protein
MLLQCVYHGMTMESRLQRQIAMLLQWTWYWLVTSSMVIVTMSYQVHRTRRFYDGCSMAVSYHVHGCDMVIVKPEHGCYHAIGPAHQLVCSPLPAMLITMLHLAWLWHCYHIAKAWYNTWFNHAFTMGLQCYPVVTVLAWFDVSLLDGTLCTMLQPWWCQNMHWLSHALCACLYGAPCLITPSCTTCCTCTYMPLSMH